MNIVITGAGFNNTGAQSMMFTTVEELKNRFPDSSISVLNASSLPSIFADKLSFRYVNISNSEYFYIASTPQKILLLLKFMVRRLLCSDRIKLNSFDNEIKKADIIIDISGFALGDQWSDVNCLSYLARIVAAKRNEIPIFIMPQSIGPFDFKGRNRERILELINSHLDYPSVIFTREEEGYRLLTENYRLSNVVRSEDLVLQSYLPYNKCIIKCQMMDSFASCSYNDSIAIIPNIHCFAYGQGKILSLYQEIISFLLEKREKIILIRHSEADAKVCIAIKELFPTEDVALMNDRMDCLRFNQAISKCKYILASRYHSIVHAYKNGIPCISLGWATKYKELLSLFQQDKYVNDIRELTNVNTILLQIEYMNSHLNEEKERIMRCLSVIQKHNCFNLLEDKIRALVRE